MSMSMKLKLHKQLKFISSLKTETNLASVDQFDSMSLSSAVLYTADLLLQPRAINYFTVLTKQLTATFRVSPLLSTIFFSEEALGT